VALVVGPETVRTGVHEKPGTSVGTMMIDSPLCLAASGSVRHASHT
jgi:hypothetical protein